MASNTHELLERHEKIRGSSDRSFGFLFVVVFGLVAVWPWLSGSGEIRLWATTVALLILTAALLRPSVLSGLNKLWMKFGLLLHKIVHPITMGLIFFFTVTPTAFVFRVLGKDPLRLKYDQNAESYWIHRDPPGPPPESMSQQF